MSLGAMTPRPACSGVRVSRSAALPRVAPCKTFPRKRSMDRRWRPSPPMQPPAGQKHSGVAGTDATRSGHAKAFPRKRLVGPSRPLAGSAEVARTAPKRAALTWSRLKRFRGNVPSRRCPARVDGRRCSPQKPAANGTRSRRGMARPAEPATDPRAGSRGTRRPVGPPSRGEADDGKRFRGSAAGAGAGAGSVVSSARSCCRVGQRRHPARTGLSRVFCTSRR